MTVFPTTAFQRATFASATFIVALVLTPPLAPAIAADLNGDRYAAPYDDEGYANDGYDDEDAPPPRRASEAPSDSYGYDRPGSIKDGYPVPMPAPDAGEGRGWDRAERVAPPPPPRHATPRYACLETWQIRQELRHRGWTDIRPMGGDGRVVHIRARRFDSSSIFRLRVARCTGEVLAARPYHLRSFAYGERPWRY